MGEVIPFFSGSQGEMPIDPQAIVPSSAQLDRDDPHASQCAGCPALEACLGDLANVETQIGADPERAPITDALLPGVRRDLFTTASDKALLSMYEYDEAAKERLALDVESVRAIRALCATGLRRTLRHPLKGECGLSAAQQEDLATLPRRYR